MLENQNQMTVIGSIVPTDGTDVNADTRRALNEILVMAGLGGFLIKETTETGVIRLNKSIFVSHHQATISLIRKLQEILEHPRISPYGFTGKLSIVVFGPELVAYKVTISRGKVAYRKASIVWPVKPAPLHPMPNRTFNTIQRTPSDV